MLKIIDYNCDEYDFPCLLVLGCFDALHAGHVELLNKAGLQAKINGLDLGVMIFTEGKGGNLIYTFEERLNILEKFKVKFVLKIDYDEEFKKTTASQFLKNVEDKLNVKAYMSGKDFRFGAGAKGKSSTLKSYAADEENGVWYAAINDVTYHDERISTSLIKEFLECGEIKTANTLLTRNYSITGKVVNGAGRGRTLGFPTMNLIYPENKTHIKCGVYSVFCKIDENCYKGIANYGPRPTFGEENPILEVYLDGYDGSDYGENLTVEFLDYIRDIQKFDSSEELTEQLKRDLQAIRQSND